MRAVPQTQTSRLRLVRESGHGPVSGVDLSAERRASEDAQFVASALEGDRAAMRALYERHVRYISGMCMRLLGSRDEALDVVQDTFSQVFAKLSELRERSLFRAWLAQIAIRFVHKRMRRTRFLRAIGLGTQTHTVAVGRIPEQLA
jgi:DNA-directed RNA polymerase specialized sigma24 family protein